MIFCPRCNAPSFVLATIDHPALHLTANTRACTRGHEFQTREVHLGMVADERELRSARRAINARRALWDRDVLIARDDRSTTQLAAAHNITPTRVRQIRASFLEEADSPKARKIRSTTQKG